MDEGLFLGIERLKPLLFHFLYVIAVLAVASLHLETTAFAAKQVPTIRIELPKKSAPKTEPTPNLGTNGLGTGDFTPKIPLGENDLPFDGEDDETQEAEEPASEPEADTAEKPRVPAKIFYDTKALPEAVKKTRDRLLKAAKAGNVDELRTIFKGFSEPPIVSFNSDGDAVDHIVENSGDGKGLETLAILLEVLETGFIHRDEGDESEVYIWPYFVDVPPEDLKQGQLIELFQIITAGDYEDMLTYGTYIFYRAGIAPNGDLKFFVAGD
ncbi:MAG: hypothetical protein ABJO30_11875 [Hyphomicrobiales bacterium]